MTTKITEKNISGIANSAVQWQSVITADGSTNTTGVAGEGYFIDTTSAAHTIVLPSSPNVGDTIQIRDYAESFGTNNVTLDVGGKKLAGTAINGLIDTNDAMVTLVYSGEDKGWLSVENEAKTNLIPPLFTQATGGTITTSGDYKIHTFTSSGCFVVSQLGNSPSVPAGGPTTVSYLVVAGGGGAENGGGGAGGFREGRDIGPSYTASPLVAPSGLTISQTTYPVTVGAGGSAGGINKGSDSIFSTITSAGGGGGAVEGQNAQSPSGAGGSGGGNGSDSNASPGGSGNTPPVSPPQGNNGGQSGPGPYGYSGGGGGATQAGQAGSKVAPNGANGGNGGNGAPTSISGTSTTYSGGGGGGANTDGYGPVTGGTGGSGGGGNGGSTCSASGTNGSANSGGGAGGGEWQGTGGSGGSGIVIIRYKYQ